MSRSRQSTTSTPTRIVQGEGEDDEPPGGRPFVVSGDERLSVSVVAADFEAGTRLARHRHRRAQLVYAIEGVMTVEAGRGLWVVPPLRALWVPAGLVHSIRMTGRVRMRTAYFDRSLLSSVELPARPVVVSVSALLREVLVRLVDGQTQGEERRARLLAVLLDELVEAPASPLEIPMPADPRLRRIAEALLADPADARDLAAWASVAGVAERTLARLFPAETGLTLVRWRQQVRLLRALERLALGEAVTSVALDLGYAGTSTFVKLFRESLGVTPGKYFAP